jgi:hypothetical protein
VSYYRYEIDKNNAVKIFSGESNIAFFYQPDWPNATPWESREQAEYWAQVFVASLEDPEYPYEAGDGPENHPILKALKNSD